MQRVAIHHRADRELGKTMRANFGRPVGLDFLDSYLFGLLQRWRAPRPNMRSFTAAIRRPRCPSRNKLAERVGFEPTVRLHAQRFSRPSRSTTLAPLRGTAYRGAIPSGQPGQFESRFPVIPAQNHGFPALTREASCVYSALLRRVTQARRALSCFPVFGPESGHSP